MMWWNESGTALRIPRRSSRRVPHTVARLAPVLRSSYHVGRHRTGSAPSRDPGPLETPAPQPSAQRHRPLQPSLLLLHARGGLCVAPAQGDPRLRGAVEAGRRVRAKRRRSPPHHRWRAAPPSGSARARPPAVEEPRSDRCGLDDQRRPPCRSRPRACRGGTRPHEP